MNIIKSLGFLCVALCVLLLVFVALGKITWNAFWLSMILLAGLAYVVIPSLNSQGRE